MLPFTYSLNKCHGRRGDNHSVLSLSFYLACSNIHICQYRFPPLIANKDAQNKGLPSRKSVFTVA